MNNYQAVDSFHLWGFATTTEKMVNDIIIAQIEKHTGLMYDEIDPDRVSIIQAPEGDATIYVYVDEDYIGCMDRTYMPEMKRVHIKFNKPGPFDKGPLAVKKRLTGMDDHYERLERLAAKGAGRRKMADRVDVHVLNIDSDTVNLLVEVTFADGSTTNPDPRGYTLCEKQSLRIDLKKRQEING